MSTAARRYYLRGRRSLELGELDQAIEALASAIDLAPHFIDARLAHATALSRLGDVPRAAQTLRAGLGHARSEPARAALWFSLGEVLTAGGDFIAAEDAFDQAAIHPAWTQRAAAGRARVHAKSGRPADAIASLLRAVGRASVVLLALAAAAGAAACKGKEEKPPPAAPPPPLARPPDAGIQPDPVAGLPPPSITREKRELAEKVLAHMESIAAAGDASQGDCTAAAAAMKALMEKARPDIEALDAIRNDGGTDKAARQWFEKAYGHRMMTVMTRVMGIAGKCKDHPAFQAAMADSPFARKRKPPPAASAPPDAPASPPAGTEPPVTGAAPQ
ncbi:MAG TPA: tetratricopeptide repeat protein [Kofleriaceae bacterium]|nr:tetratricopeptide repeat protein [Kofleriaceae bacterium]